MSNDFPTLPSISGPSGAYGCEVRPAGPLQDMAAIDLIAGAPHDRTNSPAEFTGGDTGAGLGGSAIANAPTRVDVP